MRSKTLILACATLLSAVNLASADPATQITTNVVLEDGVFYSAFDESRSQANHDGENFYDGQWYTDIGERPWIPDASDYQAFLLQRAIDRDFATVDEYLLDYYGMTYQELLDSWGGDHAAMLYNEMGEVLPLTMPNTPAERAAFIKDLKDGDISELANNLGYSSNSLLGMWGDPRDETYISEALNAYGTRQDRNEYTLGSLLQSAMRNNEDPLPIDLTGLDLSGVSGSWLNLANANISVEQLNDMADFQNTKFGTKDLTGFDPAGDNLSGADFSQTTGLNMASVNNALSIQGSVGNLTNFSGMDVSALTFNGKRPMYMDLSNTTGLNIASLNQAANQFNGVKLSGNNLTGLNLTSRIISGADLSNTTGLTPAGLAAANHLNGSSNNVNVTGSQIYRSQMVTAYQTKGLTLSAINTLLNTWTGLL